MFRFFRKHRWILILAMAVTAITFVTFMGSGPGRNRNGGAETGDLGTIYGHKVTQQEYLNARNQFYLLYFFRNHEWPNVGSIPQSELDQQIYFNILLNRKAQDLGISVSDDAAAKSAAALLQSLDRDGQHVTLDAFDQQILKPQGLTVEDFKRLARRDVILPQLIAAFGLSGALITPQEAQDLFEREYQKLQAQAVFFSASNYMTSIPITPAAIGQFYTNELAYYRLPDRVQVSYVEFNLSNYLGAAEEKIGKTNLDLQVSEIFRERGMAAIPDAKTPEEAKAKIREALLHQQAATDARVAANDFATQLFDQTPMNAKNLPTLAKQKGLPVQTPKPFDAEFGPKETPVPSTFVRAAFALNDEQPISEPIAGPSGYFVIALDKTLPSEIPSLDSIRDRVVNDYKTAMATQIAQRVGTNFVQEVNLQMAAGKNFSAAVAAAGEKAETLPPFSLDTQDLPELKDRADFRQIKQAAFTTPVGRASSFEETQDGGFILFVEKKLPVDVAVMDEQLPEFMVQLRQSRQSEAFGAWIDAEGNREFRNVPAFQKEATAGAK